jgi:hypothetical protein
MMAMNSSWLEDSQDGQYSVAAPLVHFSCIQVSVDPPERKIRPTSFYNVLKGQ